MVVEGCDVRIENPHYLGFVFPLNIYSLLRSLCDLMSLQLYIKVLEYINRPLASQPQVPIWGKVVPCIGSVKQSSGEILCAPPKVRILLAMRINPYVSQVRQHVERIDINTQQ